MKASLLFSIMACGEPIWGQSEVAPFLVVTLVVLLAMRWVGVVMSQRDTPSSDGRTAVKCLGGKGRTVAQIARELGLSQDVVRTLTGPDPYVKRNRLPGTSFRNGSPGTVGRPVATSGSKW